MLFMYLMLWYFFFHITGTPEKQVEKHFSTWKQYWTTLLRKPEYSLMVFISYGFWEQNASFFRSPLIAAAGAEIIWDASGAFHVRYVVDRLALEYSYFLVIHILLHYRSNISPDPHSFFYNPSTIVWILISNYLRGGEPILGRWQLLN
jgi:hypothetical protein